jgi:hypothetical protein
MQLDTLIHSAPRTGLIIELLRRKVAGYSLPPSHLNKLFHVHECYASKFPSLIT